MIERNFDMFSGKKDLEPIYTIKNFPVYCGVTEEDEKEDQFQDMKWMISMGSGMIQLGELLPLDILYSVSHNASIGGTWIRHHEEFAEFVHKYCKSKGILEIGGGNGILNAIFNDRHSRGGMEWTIVEPSQVVKAKGCTANYIKKMWGEQLDVAKINYDTLVHSHLMEHQYDLRRFMQLNADCLKTGQRMIFALPDLKTWLKRKYSNALFFEHTYLISSDYVENILKAYGFEQLEKKSFGNGHSLFYAAEKTENPKECRLDGKELYQSNKKDFFEFISYFKEKAAEYNKRMDESKEPVYLFGAHIFSQMLLNFGLCRNLSLIHI